MTSAKGKDFDNNKTLRDNLISIVLDGDELLKLKSLIKELKTGKIEDIVLRKAILKLGENTIDKLINFFPFYANLEHQRKNVKICAKLEKELNEKKKTLTELELKVDNIYRKLKEKNNRY
ncbi:MAG: hypothetical protein ACFFA2_09975 [Promethearchaeota archaeon]